MSWTRTDDVRAQLCRLWDSGALLASLITGEVLFPRRMTLRRPTSAELQHRFDEVRAWIAELRALAHVRLELREVRHRVLGANAVPDELWIETRQDALTLLGRTREAAAFAALVEVTRQQQPDLLGWLAQRPLRALDLAAAWPRLLSVVNWVRTHPRPAIYLRQIDLPGVDSKFVESHRGVLGELLDAVLPPEYIDPDASGIAGFNRRYGFLGKPARIRLRSLDPALSLLPIAPRADITLDVESFLRLECGASRVFITENEINFLAFPPLRNSLLVFGAGYGFDTIAQAPWLARAQLHYWGDIDTHGFAILDQLRARFPHAESFLMDRATLMAFESMWGTEETPIAHDLPRLGPEELALYDDLRDQRIRRNLRLEQERIGFAWVEAALTEIEARAG